MNRKSVWAVAAGMLLILVGTTLVDLLLHAAKVYPPMGEPMGDGLSLLASSYRLVIGVAGAWLTARLAPHEPMKHALILGCVGVALALIGAAATWSMGLAPRWYAVSLVVLALPQCWVGGRIHAVQSRKR